ncbi:hypothetical protein FXF51_26040 [Nonomuraea sp. PA05]|uniref:RHS repeat protein n=1 Tax=Nonomuraea sp. PA05 TaxID=2604466 RepID=UPI0011D4CF8E|nr:RHS repeat-associated core domain-containing protein [Nonomuraea sp. PA05]TYB62185.1 hypothetical protein FXF51_26040 [Nonomuraea sp. PA05]
MTSRIRGTAKQTFAYSGLGNDLAAITDSGGTVQATYARDLAGGLLSLKEGTGAAAATLNDLHGDLVATFTTSVQTSTAYDPFGTVTTQTGTKTGLGYQGEYTDPDTGKVNMHARWYQPGTATFTSRDTQTQAPDPSVQANRYTYANASPLTGIHPTGHSSEAVVPGGSLREAGPGYGGCISSGSICHETDSHARWWSDFVTSPGYDYLYSPQFSDEEIERLGYEIMPNGRPVDQPNFWFAEEQVQNDYMMTWAPDLSVTQYVANWMQAGGLDSVDEMEAAARVNPNDPRLRLYRKMWGVSGPSASSLSAGGSAGPPASGKSYETELRKKWEGVLRYREEIAHYATKWAVDRHFLAAVIIYEF